MAITPLNDPLNPVNAIANVQDAGAVAAQNSGVPNPNMEMERYPLFEAEKYPLMEMEDPAVLSARLAQIKADKQTQGVMNADAAITTHTENKQAVADKAAAAAPPKEQLATLYDPKNPTNKIVVPVGSDISDVYTGAGWKIWTDGMDTSTPPPFTGDRRQPDGNKSIPPPDKTYTRKEAQAFWDASGGDMTGWSLNADGSWSFISFPGQPDGAPPPPEPPSAVDDYAKNLLANQKKAAEAQKTFADSLKQLQDGTFPLTPTQQMQLDDITNNYNKLIEEQRIANKNFTMAVTQAGISAGRNIYAPEIELGNIQSSVNEGIGRVVKIQMAMNHDIATAKQAIFDNDLKLLSTAYESYDSLSKEQNKVITDIHNAAQQAIENTRAQHAEKLADARFAFDIEKERNKPILEADKRIQDELVALINKYPDAGITDKDTYTTATEKIKNSPSYKAELDKSAADAAQSRAAAAKSAADAASGGSGAAPIIRRIADDAFGNAQFEQYNPATKHWDASTSDSINSFAENTTLLDGTDSYSMAVNGALTKLVGTMAVGSQKNAARRNIAIAMSQGNPKLVVDAVKSAAKDTMGATERTRLEGAESSLLVMPAVKQEIANYINGGGDMNIFKGTLEEVAGKLGTTADPKLRTLNSLMQTYLMDYRRSLTGAAFSQYETDEYKSILPGLKDTAQQANAKIDGFIKAKSLGVDATYQTLLGDNWKQLKEMQKYTNTIDRSEYLKIVNEKGEAAANKLVNDQNAWIVDPPKGKGGTGAASGSPVKSGDASAVSTSLTSISTDKKWGEGVRATNVGQCGALVNDVAAYPGWMGDSLSSKIAVTNPKITSANVKVGDVFVQSVANDPEKHGHTGIINRIGQDSRGKFAIVTEANYGLNGKTTHDRKIYLNDPAIKGFAEPKNYSVKA